MNLANIQEKIIRQTAPPEQLCRVVVIIPAKDEAKALSAALDALRLQRDLSGAPMPHASYEVLLLLNNCTDESLEVAKHYAGVHRSFRLHILECDLPPDCAHVGTARKILMDLACDRFAMLPAAPTTAILSTDADTLVSPEWIACNLSAIVDGADAVGGVIQLLPGDLASLDTGTRIRYERDREFQVLVAKLEALLDPDPADPWPRHVAHFGASLACTPEAYRRCGGMPPVKPLEDVAFIDALRKVGARIRHAPSVHVATSARLDGRAEVGLSGQLRLWETQAAHHLPQMVDSAEWLTHRFRSMASLRRLNEGRDRATLDTFPPNWQTRLKNCLDERLATPQFLEALDCDRLIEEAFRPPQQEHLPRHSEITIALADLRERINCLEGKAGSLVALQ